MGLRKQSGAAKNTNTAREESQGERVVVSGDGVRGAAVFQAGVGKVALPNGYGVLPKPDPRVEEHKTGRRVRTALAERDAGGKR